MNIPLPPKFDASKAFEEEFLTPPIWVAMNPPPMFERTEMKRTVSEVSSMWGGDYDEEEESPVSTEHEDRQNIEVQEIVRLHCTGADYSHDDQLD